MPKAKNSSSEDGFEVVKWYTRARRFPQLIGKTPDGARIWGGPYTYTQVIAGVGLIVIGTKTTWLWGHFGLVGNALILLGAAYGLLLLLGRLPIGSRNPLSVGAGALRALSSPAHGHLGGAPVRIRRPHQNRSRVVITHNAPTLVGIVAAAAPAAAAPSSPAPRARQKRRGRLPRPRWSRPAPAQIPVPARPWPRPAPSPAPRVTPTPALTGVQRLLASTGASPQED